MKKIISAILAGACAVSAMSIAASAAGTTVSQKAATSGTDIKLTASMVPVVPVIDVTVPSSISAVLNPYGIPVTDKNGTQYAADGVTSPLYTIINKTTTSAVTVKVVPTVTVPTAVIKDNTNKETEPTIKVQAAKTGVTSDGSKKSVYMYVEASGSQLVWIVKEGGDHVWVGTDVSSQLGGDSGTEEQNPNAGKTPDANSTDGINVAVKDLPALIDVTVEDGASLSGKTAKNGQANQVAFADVTATKVWNGTKLDTNTPSAPTPASLVVLHAAVPTAEQIAESSGPFENFDPSKDKALSYANFRIAGSLDAKADWGASDKISVNVVLNIKPSSDAPTAVVDIVKE